MKLLRRILKVQAVYKIYTLLLGGLLLLLVSPILILLPRKKKQMVLFGTGNGLFIDNVKYFFLYLEKKKPDLKYYFITSNQDVHRNLQQYFDKILYYPSLKTIWILLRSHMVVTDNTVLDQNFRFVFLKGARHIQLWHGAGIKKFWNTTPKLGTRLLKPYFYFTEKKRNFDSFISTSEFFTQNYFQQAFSSKKFPITGYPRNDIFWQKNPANPFQLLETDQDCLQKIKDYQSKNSKVVIYVPTFRGVRGRGNNELAFDLVRLNQFAEENNILFIFKLHPVLRNTAEQNDFDRIVWHRSDKDVYPVLLQCDAMITDYSSIFIDYMILNRPILFYMYDKEEYEKRDRELTSFHKQFMIGHQSHQQSELEASIVKILSADNTDQKKRELATRLAFQYRDADASKRLLEHLTASYIRK
ncbi:CDP-glycerol glycerophosphotransferase family protein [Ancylomarina longa]|uniref:CDP-glycerol--glycerophosphate glycerophosphotransferase n=1 Tax=Ancylomarina longa TaxID=2487017 RepID=A0A434AW80_9BACT|nr:CDP-glycerol glycerophosphotransferase family protein [Ancylomarina longa]RUT78746.1 hypothetical protein DLK05_06300 [Ancylomarina longa]